MRTTSIGIPGLISCALLSLTMSCGQRNEEAQPAAITHTLTDSLRQIISLDTIQEAPLHGELLLNGRVDFDQEKVAPVYSLFSGEVLQVNAELGDLVKKGEPLATIHSAEIVDLEKQRKETEQQLAVATRNLEAIESMTQAGLNSERDLLQARQQAADAQAEMERLRKLSVLYTTNNENHYLLKAPISGFITKREINPHMMVRPDQGEALFTITGLDQVWIMADVYESDISKVHEGMPVRVTTLAYADQEFQGFIDKIYQVLDEESKTMRVRVRLNNPDYLLKPGMFASVYAQDKNRQQMMPRINNHAIIFENGKKYVIVVDSSGNLSQREVTVYKQDKEYSYLKTGLKKNEVVVNRNALLIYNDLK